jgi:acetyl/propionyl-CoA carboxylase alpha subunit
VKGSYLLVSEEFVVELRHCSLQRRHDDVAEECVEGEGVEPARLTPTPVELAEFVELKGEGEGEDGREV